MTDREVMQMALDVLTNKRYAPSIKETTEALRAALAQPEPIAFMRPKFMIDDGWDEFGLTKSSDDDVPLYTAPSQREWVGLTDKEFTEIRLAQVQENIRISEMLQRVEAKLKEKNT